MNNRTRVSCLKSSSGKGRVTWLMNNCTRVNCLLCVHLREGEMGHMDTRYINTCYLLRVLLRERQEGGHVVHNLVLLELCVHAAEQTKLDLIGRKNMLLSSLVVFNREATTSNCPSIFRCRISLQLTSIQTLVL